MLEYSPDDLTVTVQAGVTAGALAAALAARRQTLPLDPPGWPRRTLGGIAATAASGPLRLRYGTDARSAARRPLHPGRRRVDLGRRQGREVGDRLRRAQAPGRLARHARRHRRADAAAAPAPGGRGDRPAAAAEPRGRSGHGGADRGLDAATEPPRVARPGRAGRVRLPAAPAALAISIGSVESAVRAQHAAIAASATAAGARVETVGPAFWRTYDRTLAETGSTVLRVGHADEPADRRRWTRSAARSAPKRPSSVTACAPLGVLRVAIDAGEPDSGWARRSSGCARSWPRTRAAW